MEKRLYVSINNETIARETDRAYGCDFGQPADKYGKVPLMWFPKSQVTIEDGQLVVPMWLAKKYRMTGWKKFDGVTVK